MPEEGNYVTGARVVPAEGARVGLVTCKQCGVTLTLDPATPFDVLKRHDDWHRTVG